MKPEAVLITPCGAQWSTEVALTHRPSGWSPARRRASQPPTKSRRRPAIPVACCRTSADSRTLPARRGRTTSRASGTASTMRGGVHRGEKPLSVVPEFAIFLSASPTSAGFPDQRPPLCPFRPCGSGRARRVSEHDHDHRLVIEDPAQLLIVEHSALRRPPILSMISSASWLARTERTSRSKIVAGQRLAHGRNVLAASGARLAVVSAISRNCPLL